MFAYALILAMALWGGAIALSKFLCDEKHNTKMAIILGWSFVMTVVAVEGGAFREFMMGTIVLPIILLGYQHLRSQQKMRAHAHAYAQQQKSDPKNRR